jgi:hypothetical protein
MGQCARVGEVCMTDSLRCHVQAQAYPDASDSTSYNCKPITVNRKPLTLTDDARTNAPTQPPPPNTNKRTHARTGLHAACMHSHVTHACMCTRAGAHAHTWVCTHTEKTFTGRERRHNVLCSTCTPPIMAMESTHPQANPAVWSQARPLFFFVLF